MNVSKMMKVLFAKGVDHTDPYVYLSNQVGHRALGLELCWWIGTISVIVIGSKAALPWVALFLVIGYLIFEFFIQKQDKSNDDYIADCLIDTFFVTAGILTGWILIAAIAPIDGEPLGSSFWFAFVSISIIIIVTDMLLWEKVYTIMWKNGLLKVDLRGKGAKQTEKVIEAHSNEAQRFEAVLEKKVKPK